MLKPFLFGSLVLFCSLSSYASDSEPANCAPIRQAKVTVRVERLYWVQDNGNYKLKSEISCTDHTTIGVLAGAPAGCVYPVLSKCTLPIDGEQHLATVSGEIYHEDDSAPSTKHMAFGYHLDRNSGDIKTGEAGNADVYTQDPTVKKIGLKIQSKLDSWSPNKVWRDGLAVYIDIEDTDAP